MSVLSAESRRDFEIHRYPVLIYALVPIAALVLQAWLPRVMGRFAWFDLPLVVTVFFALSRRNAIQGSILGGILGIFEDALTGHPIGINGIAKTLVGYLAASVGILVNVENHAIRLLHDVCAFAGGQRNVFLCGSVPAGHDDRHELADGVVQGGGQFADCAGAVSPAGPDEDSRLSTLVHGMKKRFAQGRNGTRAECRIGVS